MDAKIDKKQYNIRGLLSRLSLKWRYLNFSDEANKDIQIMSPELAQLLSNYPRYFKPPYEEDFQENWDIEDDDDISLNLISQLSKLHLASNTRVDLGTILYHIKMERYRTDIVRKNLTNLALRVKQCMTTRRIDFESALRICYEPIVQEMKIAFLDSTFTFSSLYSIEELFHDAVLKFPVKMNCRLLDCNAVRGGKKSEEFINQERDLDDISYFFFLPPK
ncbi:hypothetical protein HOLleu_00271 [Holothuria leucospilota]|uniref:Uncharacterized protein n=1 Tax=Holothuria leucospilota TaxID=206669 RepID=A0A9Q1CNR0_HOLLE|nr:hypothetical protein HOLleu_00271 [Holothuria leucospilota]